MSVKEGPGTTGTRIIATRYPVTSGITAGTTKTSGRQTNLVAQKSLLRTNIKKML